MEGTSPPMLPTRAAQQGAKVPQYIVTLTATLAAMSGGAAIGWTSPALSDLTSSNSTLTVTPEQGSWVGSLLAVGALIGALPAGAAVEFIGRKKSVYVLGIPMVLSFLIKMFATNIGVLYAARLLAGIGFGAICATVPMYIAEIAEDSVRGTLCSYFQLMLVGGILYAFIAGAIFSYKMFCLTCSFLPAIFLLAFFNAPETPIYLLKKNRKEEAEKSLRRLRGNDYNIFKELNNLQNVLDKEANEGSSFMTSVCKKQSIKSLVICNGLMIFQQFSGINVVLFYSASIFTDAGSTLDPAVATIIVGFAQLGATYVSSMLMDRAGRKILLLISSGVMAVCLGALGQFFHLKESGSDVASLGLVPLGAVVLYILVFSMGFGPIPWLMSGEVLPPEIKGIGTGLVVLVNWTLAFIVTKTFQDLLDSLGAAKTYWLFSCSCCLAFVFVIFIVIETKGKSFSQIQSELSGKKSQISRTRNSISLR